jgi:hypothetical protein
VLAAVNVDTGHAIGWSDGVFSGDAVLVKAALLAARIRSITQLTPTSPTVVAATDSPEGAAAAMLLAAPGRMLLTRYTPPADGRPFEDKVRISVHSDRMVW